MTPQPNSFDALTLPDIQTMLEVFASDDEPMLHPHEYHADGLDDEQAWEVYALAA